MPFSESHGVPASTYRLQLRKEFSFAEAGRIVPYLRALGISHCYTSSILMSAAGSTHGYDVNDYHRIDAELGGNEGFADFSRRVREHGMGILLDFVPNHMGIEGSQNRWWRDVLECGPASSFADFFDIDWRDHHQSGRPRVLVPILGDHYGVMLEAGKFAIDYANGTFVVTYEGMRFPLSPRTTIELLSGAAEQPGCPADAQTELRALADVFHAVVQPRSPQQSVDRAPRDALKRRLAKLTDLNDTAATAIRAHLDAINGRASGGRNFDRLDEILSAQHYRLAHWKTGAHEVNYRRFFAIDTLVGLRMENPKVFEETHRLIGELVRTNLISGLRIDHIDGLRNPLEYLERVQGLAVRDGVAAARPFYVVVEKILADHEEIDSAWPTHGTTGYEFIRQLAGLLVDPAAEGKMTDFYAGIVGERKELADIVYGEKRLVLEEMFANAVTTLAHELANLVAGDRRWRDLTRYELTVAIREVMACLQVYRIYRRLNAECRPADAREIEHACAEATRRNPRRDSQPFEFVRDLLIGRYPPPSATVEYRVGLWRWVLTFQQYTGAVMAKSVEDTAFYVYNRFVALNEVGGNPAVFGCSVAEFHAENDRRRALSPHSMLATSTHDTKLGEDVRARLYVLSEIPDEWVRWATEWRRMNRRHKTSVETIEAPDANEEYRLYQTLIGCWPAGPFEPDDAFRQRIREHVRKAVNESKRNTHWFHPNEKWLEACDRFVDALLSPESGREFIASFRPKAQRVAELGVVNSLAQVVLKVTSPGVPDFYQGSERWNFSLVDPDNRRLVDWTDAEGFARAAAQRSWTDLLQHWHDGGIKVRLTQALLTFREKNLPVFQDGDYTPLSTAGTFAEQIVAFRRAQGGREVIVVVPRLSASLGAAPRGQSWQNTTVTLPAGAAEWTDVLTGARHTSGPGRSIEIAKLFSELPLAVLVGA